MANKLLDEILAVQTKVSGTCTVKAVLDEMTPADREALEAAFTDQRVFGTSIAKVLRQRGHNVSPHTIQRHRRGACACTEMT